MYINTIHHKKINHPKIPPTTLVLKYIFNFSNFVTYVILSKCIPYVHVLQKNIYIDYFKSKIHQIQGSSMVQEQKGLSPFISNGPSHLKHVVVT